MREPPVLGHVGAGVQCRPPTRWPPTYSVLGLPMPRERGTFLSSQKAPSPGKARLFALQKVLRALAVCVKI